MAGCTLRRHGHWVTALAATANRASGSGNLVVCEIRDGICADGDRRCSGTSGTLAEPTSKLASKKVRGCVQDGLLGWSR